MTGSPEWRFDARSLFAQASDVAARVGRDLGEMQRIFERIGSEEEAGFVAEIADEMREFAAHVADLTAKSE